MYHPVPALVVFLEIQTRHSVYKTANLADVCQNKTMATTDNFVTKMSEGRMDLSGIL